MKPFELNDLPQYRSWVSELLSGKNNKRLKDQQQIVREFGIEKWGVLLAKWEANPCGVDMVRQWEISPEALQRAW